MRTRRQGPSHPRCWTRECCLRACLVVGFTPARVCAQVSDPSEQPSPEPFAAACCDGATGLEHHDVLAFRPCPTGSPWAHGPRADVQCHPLSEGPLSRPVLVPVCRRPNPIREPL